MLGWSSHMCVGAAPQRFRSVHESWVMPRTRRRGMATHRMHVRRMLTRRARENRPERRALDDTVPDRRSISRRRAPPLHRTRQSVTRSHVTRIAGPVRSGGHTLKSRFSAPRRRAGPIIGPMTYVRAKPGLVADSGRVDATCARRDPASAGIRDDARRRPGHATDACVYVALPLERR